MAVILSDITGPMEHRRAYSHDFTAAILVFQTNPVELGLFPYVKNFFCSHKFAKTLATRVNTLYTKDDNLVELGTDIMIAFLPSPW